MVPDFKCAVCAGKQVTPVGAERLVYGDISLECVDKFCYLCDMISAGGGAEAAVNARIRGGWRKLRELLPLLTSKGTFLQLNTHVLGGSLMYWVVHTCIG